MYAEDTFFHLTVPGRIGLAILSLALAAVTVWLFRKISSRSGLIVKLGIAVLMLWLFIWLSPQAYYLYYIQIIDGLPLQNVIQAPPGPVELFHTVSFSGKGNLSEHSKGVLFWIMVGIGIYNWIYKPVFGK